MAIQHMRNILLVVSVCELHIQASNAALRPLAHSGGVLGRSDVLDDREKEQSVTLKEDIFIRHAREQDAYGREMGGGGLDPGHVRLSLRGGGPGQQPSIANFHQVTCKRHSC